MVTKNLETQCERLLEDPETFPTFMRRTRQEFVRMATRLAQRWIPPAWIEIEDIVQDLYQGVWTTLFGAKPFDPKRGVSVGRYVVYNATYYAKRTLHKARGSKLCGSPDRNPNRFERPVSSYPVAVQERHLLTADPGPTVEQFMIEIESREEAIERAMRECRSPHERIAVISISETGDLDGAGRLLYDDFDTRIGLRLGSEECARDYVRTSAKRLVRRLEAVCA